jgi:hypothetical protein
MMNGSPADDRQECEEVQELIVWYPGNALNDEERQRVDKHSAGCSTCSELLKFSSHLKELALEEQSLHPAADILVSYVEGKSVLDSKQRAVVEGHLAICRECRKQAAILETVNRDLAATGIDAYSLPREEASAIRRNGLQGLWDSLIAGLLRPVPAAIYLVVAVFAIGALILYPGGPSLDQEGTGLGSGVSPASGGLGSVIILPDETNRVREPGADARSATRIDAAEQQFLLIELIDLEAPPSPQALYTVELLREGTERPVISSPITGEVFEDNYTLCLPVGAGSLAAGRYAVRVLDPTGETVFQSSLVVR